MIATNDILPPYHAHDIAKKLRCHVRTVWRYEGQRKIPEARRIGRKPIWDRDEFDEWYAKAGRN